MIEILIENYSETLVKRVESLLERHDVGVWRICREDLIRIVCNDISEGLRAYSILQNIGLDIRFDRNSPVPGAPPLGKRQFKRKSFGEIRSYIHARNYRRALEHLSPTMEQYQYVWEHLTKVGIALVLSYLEGETLGEILINDLSNYVGFRRPEGAYVFYNSYKPDILGLHLYDFIGSWGGDAPLRSAKQLEFLLPCNGAFTLYRFETDNEVLFMRWFGQTAPGKPRLPERVEHSYFDEKLTKFQFPQAYT